MQPLIAGSLCLLLVLYVTYMCPKEAVAQIISPGVNGSSSHAVKALAGALAEKEGYGRGEFSAWINNLRAIATACCTVLYSRWYSIATARGLWAGSVWWVAGLLGGLLPQLLVWAAPASDYEEVK